MRTAFRWAADQSDLDTAVAIARQAGFFGGLVENYEPIAWAEQLIEPARAVDHPRLVSLCAIASMCCMSGRVDEALEYSNACQLAMHHSPVEVPIGIVEAWAGAVYTFIGEHERYIAYYRSHLAHGRNTHEVSRAALVTALANTGRPDEAISVATGLIDAAEATHNPYALSFALLADRRGLSRGRPASSN